MESLVTNLTTLLSLEAASSKFYNVVFSDAHADLYDKIFDSSSPKMMLRLGRVGKLSHTALKDYMKRTFDINKHFGRFFANALAFRQLQATTDLIVSGSNALQFMNRCVYPESDLDLYVDVHNAYVVCKWLMDSGETYIFDPTADPEHAFATDFEMAWNRFETRYHNGPMVGEGFHHANTARGLYGINRVLTIFSFHLGERKVQVVVTELNPLVCVLNFHSTAVMNIITHKAAYSLFPNTTFEEKLTLFTSNRTPQREQAIKKYAERGWTVVRTISEEDQENENAPFHYGKRWVVDRQSWVIQLDTTGILRDDDPLASGSFNLCQSAAPTHQPEIRFCPIVNPVLSNTLVTNWEFGLKVNTYIKVIAQMYGALYDDLDRGFYSEGPPNVEKCIPEWNEICKTMCKCSYENMLRSPLRHQLLSCPAFTEMARKSHELRALSEDDLLAVSLML